MMYFIIKLRSAGISQADQEGLEKAPRWAKICSKNFQTKTCLDIFILSLIYIYIYIYICPSKRRWESHESCVCIVGFSACG